MIGWVCGPIVELDAVVIPSFPARPTPTMRPSLMPMSALTAPRTGSRTSAPADDRRRAPSPTAGPGSSAAERSWRSPRSVRRRRAWRSSADADPQVGVAEPDAVAGRWAVAGEALGGGEPFTARLTGSGPGSRSGSRRAPIARSSRPAGRGGTRLRRARSNSRRGLTRSNGWWDETRTTRVDVLRTSTERAVVAAPSRSDRRCRRPAPGGSRRGTGAGRGPSGSTRTTSRTPSPIRTSSRTSPTRAATPGSAWSAVTAVAPACSTSA